MTRAQEIAQQIVGPRTCYLVNGLGNMCRTHGELCAEFAAALESYAAEERERRDTEMRGLRRWLHKLMGHNQWFERCESPWCHPTEDNNPAQEVGAAENWPAIAARIREAGKPKSSTVGDGLHRTSAITAQKQNLP